MEITLPDLAATGRLAAAIAGAARARDVIALWGDLGAGKTAFARAFIHARPGGDQVGEVPSPTFTLVQVYELDPPVWHFDLYRLKSPYEAVELGIEEALTSAISLIEWPDRLGSDLPGERIDVRLEFPANGPRRARVTPHGDWVARCAKLRLG